MFCLRLLSFSNNIYKKRDTSCTNHGTYTMIQANLKMFYSGYIFDFVYAIWTSLLAKFCTMTCTKDSGSWILPFFSL